MISNSKMSIFFDKQGHIRRRPSSSSGLWRDRQGVYAEVYVDTLQAQEPRRTQLIGKMVIFG
jgi:hypothetical protein